MTSEPFQPDLVTRGRTKSNKPTYNLPKAAQVLPQLCHLFSNRWQPHLLQFGKRCSWMQDFTFFWVCKAPQALSLILVLLKVVQENRGCSRGGMVWVDLHLPHAHREDVKAILVKSI